VLDFRPVGATNGADLPKHRHNDVEVARTWSVVGVAAGNVLESEEIPVVSPGLPQQPRCKMMHKRIYGRFSSLCDGRTAGRPALDEHPTSGSVQDYGDLRVESLRDSVYGDHRTGAPVNGVSNVGGNSIPVDPGHGPVG